MVYQVGTYTITGVAQIVFETNDAINAMRIICDTATAATLTGTKVLINGSTAVPSSATELKQDKVFEYSGDQNIEHLVLDVPAGCTVRIFIY